MSNKLDNAFKPQPIGKRQKYALVAMGVMAALAILSGVSSCDDNATTAREKTAEGDATAAAAYKAAADVDAEIKAGKTPEEALAAVNARDAAAAAKTILAKIEDGALDDLTDKSEYPRLNRSLGRKGVLDAMDGAKAAAIVAAMSPACDRVYAASPEDLPQRPFTRTHQKFFANCTNGEQWHFTAAELKDAHGKWLTATTAKAPRMSDTDREEQRQAASLAVGSWHDCESALAARLPDPDSMDSHYLTEKVEDVDSKGRHTVSLGFHYQNQYGARVKARGFCTFSLDGQKVTTEIYQN